MGQSWTDICSPNAALKPYFPHQSGVLDTFIYLVSFFPPWPSEIRHPKCICSPSTDAPISLTTDDQRSAELMSPHLYELQKNCQWPLNKWITIIKFHAGDLEELFFFFFSTTIWRQFCSWRVVVQGQKKKRSHKLKCFCSHNLKGIRKRKKKTWILLVPKFSSTK